MPPNRLTFSTYAERLVREYGADIRYIAPWKKWVVWDDTHWQVDTGALLYTKQLEMVRNIYAELSKVCYDREADCPMWKQFVREIMDYKADLITFLQTAAGWSVSGDTSD
jgi:phage/plasmid-associated DNA primase